MLVCDNVGLYQYRNNVFFEAPVGSKIEVIVERYSKGFAYDGCEYGGVEIKTGQDKRHTGYR